MGLLVNQEIAGHVFVISGNGTLCDKRKKLLEDHNARYIHISDRPVSVDDLLSQGRDEVDHVVDGLFVIPSTDASEPERDLNKIVEECKRLRIPVNVSEHPDLCTFSLPSTHTDGPFQLAVSTNGMGCRLGNRLKRVAVAALPPNTGDICRNVGRLRKDLADADSTDDDDDADQSIALNQLVTSAKPSKQQKLRWLAQMVEYYPLSQLASITAEDLLVDLKTAVPVATQTAASQTTTTTTTAPQRGSISLVGAGPGTVGLLTTEALQEINSADYILADKLVPEEVLSVVPRNTPVFIARKFPGNAERAQEELLNIGLEQLQKGQHVVRLKQGDPYIYGRGAEEFLFFKERGYVPHVVAGVTSAFAAPLLANIPPTHRGYADQVLVCTGTGRAGKLFDAPEWVPTRTTIFLMALHRIDEVAERLISHGWDPEVPVAAVERASCPDQRVVRSKLAHIAEALQSVGSRPPGLLVVGRVCEAIEQIDAGEKWRVESR